MARTDAFVDESLRVADGLYVMAAAVIDGTAVEQHREAMRALLLARQPRLHWRDERAGRREQLAAAVGALELDRLVVVGTRLPASRQVRGRRKCLQRLLWHLGTAGVAQVVCESRGPAGDLQDRRMIDAWRTQHVIPDRLRVQWGDPYAEPLLWSGDILAGAAAAGETGDNRYLKLLGTVLIDRITID